MGSNFSFDEKAMNALVGDMVKDVAKDEQKWMDDFARRHKGQSGEQITPALKREWERRGGSITTAEARDYANLISEGTRVEFKA